MVMVKMFGNMNVGYKLEIVNGKESSHFYKFTDSQYRRIEKMIYTIVLFSDDGAVDETIVFDSVSGFDETYLSSIPQAPVESASFSLLIVL